MHALAVKVGQLATMPWLGWLLLEALRDNPGRVSVLAAGGYWPHLACVSTDRLLLPGVSCPFPSVCPLVFSEGHLAVDLGFDLSLDGLLLGHSLFFRSDHILRFAMDTNLEATHASSHNT